MPVAPNTSSSMIVRTANPNAAYTIYNLGLNQILLGQDLISAQQIGNDWDFAGPGAVNFDFTGNTLDLWVKRTTTQETDDAVVNQFNEFSVYNISGNAIKSYAVFGFIGPDWQVQGFGFFFRSNFGPEAVNPPHPDMVTRSVSNGTAEYLVYENGGNQFTGKTLEAAVVGANWVTAGLGTYTLGPLAQLIVLNDGAGLMSAYAYRDGRLVNNPGDNVFADVGNDWEVLGFGHFSSQFGLNMLIRNVDPASANFQQVWIYDVIKPDPDKDEYVAQLSTAVSPGQTQAGVLGAIGGNLTVAGFAPVGGALGPFTDDMVMRDTANGALLLYSIRDDKLVPGAIGVPLTPPPSEPIAPTSTIGGIAIDLSVPTSGSTSQLVQAMAGLGGGSGAADGSNTAPLGADTSQQTFLTAPHA
jgi:hypothetical protein